MVTAGLLTTRVGVCMSACVICMLFVCVSTQRKRTRRQAAEAPHSSRPWGWQYGGQFLFSSFYSSGFSPKYLQQAYMTLGTETTVTLYFIVAFLQRHREVNQSCVSGVTTDKRPLTELGSPMASGQDMWGGAMGRSASRPGVSVPKHSITLPMN